MSLTFLTWNLALMKRSAQAPHAWSPDRTEAAFRDIVLERSPDLVLLQELPRMVPFIETHGMIRANPESHSGNLATLAKHQLLLSDPAVHVVPGCAILSTFDDLTIANVHLAPGPGKQSEGQRLEQLAQIVESSPTPDVLIVGDTNTRIGEIETIENAGFVSDRPPSPTWDSNSNPFNSDRESGAFRAYFTRWFASPNVIVSDVEVVKKPITFDGDRFYLSDHFGLAGTVSIAKT